MKINISITLFAFSAASFFAAHSVAITLEESITSALKKNPDVTVLKRNFEAVEEELNQAKAKFLPIVSFNASTGPEITDSSSSRNRSSRQDGDNRSVQQWRTETEITVNQLIFDGKNTINEKRRQEQRRLSARQRWREQGEITAFQTTDAYLEIIKNRRLVALAEANVRIHEAFLSQMEERLKYQRGSASDVMQAKVRLARSWSRFIVAKGDLEIAKIGFERETGMSAENVDDFEVPSNLPKLSGTLEQTLEHMENTHPAIQSDRYDLLVAQAEFRKSKSAFLPDVNFEFGVSRNENLDGARGPNNDASALLNLSYDLYRGGEDSAKKRELRKRWSGAEAELEQTRLDKIQELKEAWSKWQVALERRKYIQEQVESNVKVIEGYRDQFKVGRRTLLDVLDSENELYGNRVDFLSVEFELKTLMMRIMVAIGDFLPRLEQNELLTLNETSYLVSTKGLEKE